MIIVYLIVTPINKIYNCLYITIENLWYPKSIYKFNHNNAEIQKILKKVIIYTILDIIILYIYNKKFDCIFDFKILVTFFWYLCQALIEFHCLGLCCSSTMACWDSEYQCHIACCVWSDCFSIWKWSHSASRGNGELCS